MITKVENNYGLCRDNQKNIVCAYYNNGGRCKKPDYENCLDMVTDKSYIFVEVEDVPNPR